MGRATVEVQERGQEPELGARGEVEGKGVAGWRNTQDMTELSQTVVCDKTEVSARQQSIKNGSEVFERALSGQILT